MYLVFKLHSDNKQIYQKHISCARTRAWWNTQAWWSDFYCSLCGLHQDSKWILSSGKLSSPSVDCMSVIIEDGPQINTWVTSLLSQFRAFVISPASILRPENLIYDRSWVNLLKGLEKSDNMRSWALGPPGKTSGLLWKFSLSRIFFSYDIPPHMKILNMVIPIPMHLWSLAKIGALEAALSHMSSNDMWRY